MSPFTAAAASPGVSTPIATMSTAPRSAAAGRSRERNGTLPAATARYVRPKTSRAAVMVLAGPPKGCHVEVERARAI